MKKGIVQMNKRIIKIFKIMSNIVWNWVKDINILENLFNNSILKRKN